MINKHHVNKMPSILLNDYENPYNLFPNTVKAGKTHLIFSPPHHKIAFFFKDCSEIIEKVFVTKAIDTLHCF